MSTYSRLGAGSASLSLNSLPLNSKALAYVKNFGKPGYSPFPRDALFLLLSDRPQALCICGILVKKFLVSAFCKNYTLCIYIYEIVFLPTTHVSLIALFLPFLITNFVVCLATGQCPGCEALVRARELLPGLTSLRIQGLGFVELGIGEFRELALPRSKSRETNCLGREALMRAQELVLGLDPIANLGIRLC